MFPFPALMDSDPGTIVALTNLTVVDTGTSTVRRAGIRVSADGYVYRYKTTTGWEVAYQWITPIGDASTLYEVSIASVVFFEGFTFYTSAAAEGVWVDLSSDRDWEVRDANSTPVGNTDVTFLLRIRYNGGALIDQADTRISAIWDIS